MLKSLAFLTAVSMVSYFNPGALEREYTDIDEENNYYEYYHSFSSGTFDSPGSSLDGCKKYTQIRDMILGDSPEIHENYDTLVVGSDIAPGYLEALRKRNGKGLDEYFLLCPLETTKNVDYETNTLYDTGYYSIKAVWQTTPEIVVRSKDQSMPIDMNKLREMIPEAKCYAPDIQNNKDSYIFYISTISNNNLTFATDLDRLLTEDDIKSVISCRKDNLASVQFEGNWFSDRINLPTSPNFSADEIETVSEFFTSKNIGFSVTDNEDNKDRKNIVFDEDIPAAEYLELDFELGEKTGITCGDFSWQYAGESTSIDENSIEYFDIVMGDANDDGELSLADAISIMQSIGNPDEYRLTPQEKYNADVFNPGDGITNNDALAIQKKLIGLTDSLSVF